MKGVDFEDFQVLFEACRCHQSSSNIKSCGAHSAKAQKYEQGKIGLQFFDMWY